MPTGTPGATAHAPPRPRLAWCVVAAVVAVVLGLHALRPDPAEAAYGLELVGHQVQVVYGTDDLARSLGGVSAGSSWEALSKNFDRGPVAQRHRFAVVAADLKGPEKGTAILDETARLLRERSTPLAGTALAVDAALRRRFAGAALDGAERALLRKELGWFGDLALAPAGSPERDAVMAPARRAARTQILVVVAVLGGLGVGVLAAILFWIAVHRRDGPFFLLGPGAAPHGIYAETFAAWMVLYVAVGLLVTLVHRVAGIEDRSLAVEGGSMLLTLGALAWPVWRGVPFDRVRDDLGLRLPARPAKEILAGVISWFASLPLLAAATILVVVLAWATGALEGDGDPLAAPKVPGHPIMGDVVKGDRWLLIFFVATFVAPVVEETFFRGALYRHLRDATGGRGRIASAVLSATLSGFVFAVLHPQGLLAVPLLMAVAVALSQAREWRGNLLAPMATHALHNGLVTAFAWLQFGRG